MTPSRQSSNTLLTESGTSDACPSDDDLLAFALGKLPGARHPALETHLDDCDTCQRVLSEAAHALATAVTTPLLESGGDDWNTTFRRGDLVDRRYVIQRFITRGGMGEVYDAFDRKLSQRVALKTVTSTAGDNDRAVRRLKAEVQLARRVSHPNVCRIYDLGTHALPGTGGEIHFLTMEFVEGETLGQRVRLAGALPVREAKKITRDLLQGLRAVHAAGVLHRDFKSDNVMLRPGGEVGSQAIVLDFGLARALDRDDASSASQSSLVGTFGYIAPEQWEGRPHTRASDLYSFGVVWFELLTGQLPFDDEPSSVSRVRKAFRGEVPAPSHVNPELPPELDALVLRCLERAPKKRFENVDELLTALDALEAPGRRLGPRRLAAVCAMSLAVTGAGWLLHATESPGAASGPRANERPAHALKATGTPATSAVPKPTSAPDDTQADMPIAASSLAAPSSRDTAPPRRASRARAAKSTRPATAEPPDRREPTAISPVAAPDAEPVLPRPPPAQVPPGVKTPDWENPFGAIQPAALAATAT